MSTILWVGLGGFRHSNSGATVLRCSGSGVFHVMSNNLILYVLGPDEVDGCSLLQSDKSFQERLGTKVVGYLIFCCIFRSQSKMPPSIIYNIHTCRAKNRQKQKCTKPTAQFIKHNHTVIPRIAPSSCRNYPLPSHPVVLCSLPPEKKKIQKSKESVEKHQIG
jgi:hypothetical protein